MVAGGSFELARGGAPTATASPSRLKALSSERLRTEYGDLASVRASVQRKANLSEATLVGDRAAATLTEWIEVSAIGGHLLCKSGFPLGIRDGRELRELAGGGGVRR